jgi:hypothetical protein|tara:strand:- start:2807 stop:3283 length:477 start_codon:yes stop_codon:yes gene_type:complete
MEKYMKHWKIINNLEYPTPKECVDGLISKGYNVSKWIINIADNLEVKEHKYPVHLSRVRVEQLGFEGPCKLKDIYQRFDDNGYKLVPPELAIFTRFLYDEQPTGEWLRIATPLDSMIDTDGVPHLPKLGKALDMFFIETYWSYPDAIFHPHNDFVVRL